MCICLQCNSGADSPELVQTSQIKGSGLHKTPLTLGSNYKLQGSQEIHTFDQLSTNSRLPTIPLGLIICENDTQQSGKCLLSITVLLWRTQISTGQMKRHIGWGLRGSQRWSFPVLKTHHPPSISTYEDQPGKLTQASLVTRVFLWVSLCMHEWLNHWSHDWTQSLAPLLEYFYKVTIIKIMW